MNSDSSNPLVSIVLPVYNGEKYLDQAIESCVKQTFKDFELIIVDDKSTDSSLKIAEDWKKKDSRIKIVKNIENKKLPATLNTGFAHATGAYYTWTSDDNVLREDFLTIMVSRIKETEADIVYSDYIAIGENGEELETCLVSRPQDFPLKGGIGASFMYKKKVHGLLNGFDTSLFLLEDYDFWVRAHVKGLRYFHINDVPYRYRRHGSSLTETSKNKIVSGTIRYRFKMRNQLRLSENENIALRTEILRLGIRILSIPEILTLAKEITFMAISGILRKIKQIF